MGWLQSIVNTQRLMLLFLLRVLMQLSQLLHAMQLHLCVRITRSQDVSLFEQSDCAQVRNSGVLQQLCELGITKSCFAQFSVKSRPVQPFQC
jgi:hypothetical protein